jgi:Protein of unknown function (DUF1501)
MTLPPTARSLTDGPNLTLLGEPSRYCDGVSRRSFLKIGSLAFGGLSLAGLLRAEEQAGIRSSKKSVIMVYLAGGISHQDTFDLKPEAPVGIRGEFKPIDTAVPGVRISEHLPMLAGVADRMAIIRTVVGQRDEHSSYQSLTGHLRDETIRQGYPSFGSVISKLVGPVDPVTPAFVDLFPTMQHRPYNSPGPGSLGPRYAQVKADGEQLASMKLRYVTSAQLSDRRQLLGTLDGLRRGLDSAATSGLNADYQKAFDVLSSSKLVTALDLDKESKAVRDRYGRGSSNHLGDGAPMWNDQLLAARRLVEAGVRCVTVAYGFWDTHGNNFGWLKERLPLFDRGISALIEDLHNRGLDRDTTVVVWGEFGRTPRINKDAGRDHWARVNSALIAGGGLRMGQVVGATDKLADSAIDRPVPYRDVLATVYSAMGIDASGGVTDISGRRLPILSPDAAPIRELA